MKRIHLVLADDQKLFVESLKRVIETIAPDVTVDAVALNGSEAVAAAENHRPDVVLMDVRMPVLNGVEATKRIRQALPETNVIILTTYDDDEYLQEALQAGAVGYLLKDIPPEELISAVSAVSKGAFIVSPTIAQRLIRSARDTPSADPSQGRYASVPRWLSDLSRREREILSFIACGMSNKEIAEALFIAEQTVKNHVSAIYSKVGENDRYRLIGKIKECLDRGYLTPHAAH